MTERVEGGGLRERRIIFATLDVLPISGKLTYLTTDEIERLRVVQLDGSRSITIHALDVELLGPIVIPGADVQIRCRKLIVGKRDDSDVGARIDVSAAPVDVAYQHPFLPARVADTAAEGASGDAIAASLQKGELTWAPDLIVKPTDSDEDRKRKQAAAQMFMRIGMPGERGGSISISCDELALQSRLELAADGGQGYPGACGQQGGPGDTSRPNGGAGGRGGRPGDGGDAGSVRIAFLTANATELVDMSVVPGGPGVEGQPGAGGTAFASSGATAAPADTGKDGTAEPQQITAADLGRSFDDALLLRVVQKARHIYLFNQPTSFSGEVSKPPRWNELGKLLTWTVAVLADYAILSKTATVIEKRKNGLYLAAHSLLLNYQASKTIDRKAADWVSPLSSDTMFKQFDDALVPRKRLEDRFVAMNDKLTDKVAAQEALNRARNDAKAAIDECKARYDLLYNQLSAELPRRVDAAIASCDAVSARLADLLETLESDVQNHFDCSLDKVLRAAESMAFTVENPEMAGAMAVVQIASLVNSGMNEIETDRGPLKKKNVVDQIERCTGDVKENARGALYERKGGEWVLRPEKKLLLVELEKFKGLVDSLTTALGSKVTEPISRCIDDYTDAIRERGDAVLMHELYLVQLMEAYRAYTDAVAHHDTLDKKADPLVPYEASTVSFFAGLYQREVEKTVVAVVELQRKFVETTLREPDQIDLAEQLGNLWNDDPPPDKADLDALSLQVSNLRDGILGAFEQAEGAIALVPHDDKKRSQICVKIGPGAALDELKTLDDDGCYSTTVLAVPGAPAHPDETFVHGGADYCDIRVLAAAPRVFGAKTKDGKLTVHITQAPRASIVDQNNGVHTFYRETPRQAIVEHPTATIVDSDLNDDTGKSAAGVLTDKFLDAAGVYGRWTIRIRPGKQSDDANEGLDLSGITGFAIYFTAYARSTSGRPVTSDD